MSDERRTVDRSRTLADRVPWIALTAVVVVAAVAWRATLGVSFLDDGYYAAVTLRLAQGARLFADEMYLQSVGFLAAVPFTKLWTLLFGTTGVVAAMRLFYVALASVVSFVVFRLLKPSLGTWPAFAGAAVPFLAPAYNVLAVSYDTMATLGMTLACAAAFAALRDRSRPAAVAAGAAAAFASVSYPPMAVAAIALLVAFIVVGRDRRLLGAVAVGAVALVAVFLAWLLARTSFADIGHTVDYVVAGWRSTAPGAAGGRTGSLIGHLFEVLGRSWLVPVWAWFLPATAIGVAAATPGVRAQPRLRGRLLAALPAALVLPVVAVYFAPAPDARNWTLGGNYLIAFVLLAAPALFSDLGRLSAEVRKLVWLSLPAGIIGILLVDTLSSASLYWASGWVGLACFGMAVAAWWAHTVEADAGPAVAQASVTFLVAALLVGLFGATMYNQPPLTLHDRIATGALAGMTTDAPHARSIAAVEALTSRYVHPGTGVLFVADPGGYLLQGGDMVTSAVWLDYGPADAAAVSYFDRSGRWPDVVFLPIAATMSGGPRAVPASDPLVAALAQRYKVAEVSTAAGLTVMVPR